MVSVNTRGGKPGATVDSVNFLMSLSRWCSAIPILRLKQAGSAMPQRTWRGKCFAGGGPQWFVEIGCDGKSGSIVWHNGLFVSGTWYYCWAVVINHHCHSSGRRYCTFPGFVQKAHCFQRDRVN